MRHHRNVAKALCLLIVLCATPPGALADPAPGTLEAPIQVDAFPYVTKGTTVGAASTIAKYTCAGMLDLAGPERVYRFNLARPAKVTAWVEGDSTSVDIDVHLLNNANVTGGSSTGCVARSDKIAEAEMPAGDHYVVVDTFQSTAFAGPYVLHLEAIGDEWIERTIADGITWRSRRFESLAGGPQVINELVFDPKTAGLSIKAIDGTGCQTLGEMAVASGAIVAINGGYFNRTTCDPTSLLKTEGQLVKTDPRSHGAFGFAPDRTPMVELITANMDWPAARDAHGGGPVLVTDGVARSGIAAWSTEGFTDPVWNSDNPRTIGAFDTMGMVHFATFDGRRPNAKGLPLDDLAAFAASSEMNALQAVNLDGGGSTTMYVRGAIPSGIVNYPSDFGASESPSHAGSRLVSGGFFLYAPPFNHPPRFQTMPQESASGGEPYSYDADALDLDVEDTVTFTLVQGPDGMSIGAADGHLSYTPPTDAASEYEVVIGAEDGRGARSEQRFRLIVSGDQAETPADAGSPPANGGGGGCAIGPSAGLWNGLGLFAALFVFGRIRRRRR